MISVNALAWLASRGVSQATLESMPVASGTVFFPGLETRSEAVFFKYPGGWKARSFPEKSFISNPGLKLSFWNIEAVLEAAPSTVFITEGEVDALSLVESGIPSYQVLSVPNGARENPAKDLDSAYPYVWEALKCGLNKADQVIWCGDSDGPGETLRADMVRILGCAKFLFVRWPEGAKDANDVLQAHGPDELRNICLSPIPWPQEGLFRLSELAERKPLEVWTPDLEPFAGKIAFAARTLSIVTGQPGHGKTVLFNQIIFEIIRKYGISACIAAFETRPKPHLRKQLRTLITNLREFEMSDEEKAQADEWINQNYLFIVHHEERPDLNWLLDVAETAVVRHKARILLIDPWNRLESQKRDKESDTDYILRCLKALYVFANDLDCMVQIIVHPSKMDAHRRGQPPTLEDCSNSKHWENIADQGLVVHRPAMFEDEQRKTEVQLFHRKARFEELGYPCRIWLNYNLDTRRFQPLHISDE